MNPDFGRVCDIVFGVDGAGGVVIRALLWCEGVYEFICQTTGVTIPWCKLGNVLQFSFE